MTIWASTTRGPGTRSQRSSAPLAATTTATTISGPMKRAPVEGEALPGQQRHPRRAGRDERRARARRGGRHASGRAAAGANVDPVMLVPSACSVRSAGGETSWGIIRPPPRCEGRRRPRPRRAPEVLPDGLQPVARAETHGAPALLGEGRGRGAARTADRAGPGVDVERERQAGRRVVVHPAEHRQVVVLDTADDRDDQPALRGLGEPAGVERGSWIGCTTASASSSGAVLRSASR